MRATSILDPKFKYTNAVSTDIRKTFRRAKKDMKRMEEAKQNILKTSFPGLYFPIPGSIDEIEFAECQRLMHQDMDSAYPWEN